MNKKLFDQLIESVEEAGKITRDQKQRRKVLNHEEINVKSIRNELGFDLCFRSI